MSCYLLLTLLASLWAGAAGFPVLPFHDDDVNQVSFSSSWTPERLSSSISESSSSSSSSSSSTIEWGPCTKLSKPGLDCADFGVPMDWSKPSTSPKINLKMARLKATNSSARIGSLIFNPGGPGASAISYCYAQMRGIPVFGDDLVSRFDIICPDPRGVGQSSPVKCNPEMWNAREPLFPTDEAGYDKLVAQYKALGESCLEKTGDLVKYVDTVSVARDFEAIRVALDDGKFNYLGESYGTQIGVTYAELFPENIRAMALDGVLDHSASGTYFLISESETYETVLKSFFTYCNEVPTCALHGQNVSAIFNEVVAMAAESPIPAPGCLPTAEGSYAGSCFPETTVEDVLFNAQSYLTTQNPIPRRSEGWHKLGRALHDAVQGNATLLASSTAESESSSVWQGLAVGCLDWQRMTSFADMKYKQALTASTSPYTRGASQSYTYEAQCAGWPMPTTNLQRSLNQTALALTPPLLLANAFYDPSTSYTWASSVKSQIPNGVLLSRDGYGHTSYSLKGEVAKAIDAYLIDGVLPEPNTIVDT